VLERRIIVQDRKPVYWTCEKNAESFWAQTIDDAIKDYVDNGFDPDNETNITVYGYAPRIVERQCCQPLRELLEWLDDEYAYDTPTEPNEAMIDAEKAFVDAILREYVPQQCDLVAQEIIYFTEV
jgi:hypothetical protein